MSPKKDTSNTTTEAKDKGNGTLAPLPVGWTQIKRRPRQKKGANQAANGIDWCCDDPACPRPSNKRRRTFSNDGDKDDMLKSSSTKMAKPSGEGVIEGQAVICLHDVNPSWFQGYFLPNASTKPWGLLAVQEELDECLECADGGYHQVTLTVFPRSTNNQRKKQSWKNVEWTGGDMMKLDAEHVAMETDRMITGSKAVPYINRYFTSIVEKMRIEEGSASASVLELLPDIAILVGPMRITLSNREDGMTE